MAINSLSWARPLGGRVYGQCAPPTVSTLSDEINNQVRKHEILLLGSHLKRRCDPVCGVGSVPVCSPNSILLSFWFKLSAENWSQEVYTLLQLLSLLISPWISQFCFIYFIIPFTINYLVSLIVLVLKSLWHYQSHFLFL